MEKWKRRIIKIGKWDKLPFLLYMLMIVLLHFFLILEGDDVFFQNILREKNMGEIVALRYATWTSRIIIEVIMISLLQFPFFVFKILNIGMFGLLLYSLTKLFGKKKNRKLNWVICIALFLLPFPLFHSAGWAATCLNYLWPLALGLWAMLPIKKVIEGKPIKIIQILLSVIAILYACNQEQMAVVLCIVYLVGMIYCLRKKKRSKVVICLFFLTVISLIFIITCPGNEVRKWEETLHWFPEHASYSFIDKLQLGITSTMKYLVLQRNVLFIAFTFIMGYMVYNRYRSIFYRMIGWFPFLGSIFVPFFAQDLVQLVPKIETLIKNFTSRSLVIQITNYTSIYYYVVLFAYLMILACILISLYLIFKNTKHQFLAIGIYIIGLGSRIAMGLSPTVFASEERTCIFFYMSFIILIILMLRKFFEKEKEEEKQNRMKIPMAIFIVLGFFNHIKIKGL